VRNNTNLRKVHNFKVVTEPEAEESKIFVLIVGVCRAKRYYLKFYFTNYHQHCKVVVRSLSLFCAAWSFGSTTGKNQLFSLLRLVTERRGGGFSRCGSIVLLLKTVATTHDMKQ